MHILKEELPVTMDAPGMKMQFQTGLGGMAVGYCEFGPMSKEGAKAIFDTFPEKCCLVPHWGYMIKGSMHLEYRDGTEEFIKAGEVFYMPAGHIGWSDEEMVWIEVSPDADMAKITESLPQ